MGIADLFRPKHRHSDVRVRTEAVRALTADDAATLIQVARTDRDIGVRRIALEKIETPDVLAELASAETERSLRDFAGERAAQLWTTAACAEDADNANNALAGIIKLGDQRALVDIALRAQNAGVRKKAFGELRDPRALADLAKRDGAQDIRLAAVARIDDGDVLRALAIDTTTKEIGLAAVDKLDDADRLENIASKAKNKAVRQRARKIVQEMADAERAKQKSTVPDEVKRRRAEKAQLIREVEGLADSFDFDRVALKVTAATEAWSKLAPGDDGDDRFAKAIERFWKRKQIHDETARSADELRAVEREARASAAMVPVAPPPPVAEPAVEDEEAKARREERERRRAEMDAKRAAETAEREAKRAADAERGTAIAASLTALCEDMEKLAEGRDGRAIDRLLQQAGKVFGDIGKVPAEQRDALSDRYTAARGKLVIKSSELREAEDWQRFQNVPKAEALISTAKELLAAENVPDLGNRLRSLQALWKEVGPMPQRRSKELWDQFKQICDAIYERVKGQRAVDAEKFEGVAKAKEALIAEAEQLAESTDWAATAARLKELQAQWKESGHLPRKQGDELWKRFRAACDRFFERRKPQLDARHAEEADNLVKKQALVARAQAVADGAPGTGGWGKAIAEIKSLQQQWKEIGYVPRRDADAIYKAFRGACDALFAKRDSARDAEANEHRAAIDEIKAEIAAVLAGPKMERDGLAPASGVADVVARAIALRAKVREQDSRELSQAADQMTRHVVETHADAVRGTELDPAALRGRRDKLIARAEELLPKAPVATQATGSPEDIAAQLKQAMRANAFGDLRFSGRDPVEVIDELRHAWLDAGPILDEVDRSQQARFEELCNQVLAASRRDAAEEPAERGDRGDRGRRRRDRRDRDDRGDRGDRAAAPAPAPAAATPVATYDAITAPAKLPFEPLPPPGVPAAAEAAPRAKSPTQAPPTDEVDDGWDMGDEDPTAKPETPSSSEMAGDGATGGDGIDEPGWD